MKKYKSERLDVLSRYSYYSRDELIARMDECLSQLTPKQASTAKFNVDVETYQYESAEYPKLFLNYDLEETDAEEAAREAKEAEQAAIWEGIQAAEFERLRKIYGH